MHELTPEEQAASGIDALHSIANSLEVLMSIALAMLPPAKREEAQRLLDQMRGEGAES